MSTLSENIKIAERLINTYKTDCEKMKIFINEVKKYSPSLFGRLRINGSYSLIKWNNDNFHLFAEHKGVNIFLINLLTDYKKFLLQLLHEIESCQNELNLSLSLYDMEVLYFEPMNVYQRDMLDKDRLKILTPINNLENLKTDICSDNFNLSQIELELSEREVLILKYNSYTISDILSDYENFKNELIDL
jgi:hypothetical protein